MSGLMDKAKDALGKGSSGGSTSSAEKFGDNQLNKREFTP